MEDDEKMPRLTGKFRHEPEISENDNMHTIITQGIEREAE
jgi:hypothetical protein